MRSVVGIFFLVCTCSTTTTNAFLGQSSKSRLGHAQPTETDRKRLTPGRPALLQFQSKDPNSYNKDTQRSLLDLSRFLSPRIDDPALPLSDALVAQIIAPTVQVVWLTVNHAPAPSWIAVSPNSVMLLTPVLLHGAALAVCWGLGALAARAYEIDAVAPVYDEDAESPEGDNVSNELELGKSRNDNSSESRFSYSTVLIRTLQAGAFATGLLILGTQLDLFVENGFRYVQLGDAEDTDFRIRIAAVELVNDVFFEALVLIPWRLWVADQNRKNAPGIPPQ